MADDLHRSRHLTWEWVRRVILFAIGVTILLDILIDHPGQPLLELALGLVLIGMIPVDILLSWFPAQHTKDPDRDRQNGP